MKGSVKYFKGEWGFIQTRNGQVSKDLYFSNKDIVEGNINEGDTVEFEISTQEKGQYKGTQVARSIKKIERNDNIHGINTEQRDDWYVIGEAYERDFIENIVPKIKDNLIIHPEKEKNPAHIDLLNIDTKGLADLKTQNTPFFTAERYNISPQYAVTFNKKDYDNYEKNYPNCDIYFWVDWKQLSYKSKKVNPLSGVWKINFSAIKNKVENNLISLHTYQSRMDDDHNAKDSYVLNLEEMERVL
ncbi:cold-shock protein [Kurthia massiliensis]|uniref:cold-shock protein n=1 Tax=Kurthia massiliensis TaxID=1033739 RepID=UPI000287E4CF|nr:cold shock domain-containing protein [Kurthia massiliensis]